MPDDKENPYVTTATMPQSNAIVESARSIAVSRLLFLLLAMNIASLAGIALCGYANRDPQSIPLGMALVIWGIAIVPISSICVLIYSVTFDRRTSRSMLRIAVSVVCLLLWSGLAVFTVSSMRKYRMQREREYEEMDWQEQSPGEENTDIGN